MFYAQTSRVAIFRTYEFFFCSFL